MVVAPEHEIINKLENKITNLDEVRIYQNKAALKSDFERSEINKEKTGVELTSVKEKVHKVIDEKLEGKTVVKEIYVKNRIYNIVVK